MSFKDYKRHAEEYGMGGNSDFMRLEQGDNIVRVVTEFQVYGRHTDPDNIKKTRTCVGKEKGCPYCEANDKVRVRYLGWVIDKKDEKFKLLEIGYTIFKQIGQLQEDEEYSFETLPDYNLKIKRSGEGLQTEYQVVASPKRYELAEKTLEEIKKLKPPTEIVDAMKDKELKYVQGRYGNQKTKDDDIPIIEEDQYNQTRGTVFPPQQEDIDVKDIPF